MHRLSLPLLFLLFLSLPGRLFSQADISFKKSWIHIVPPDLSKPLSEGDEIDVQIDYHLDPAEAAPGGTRLVFWPLGPWVQNPDARYGTVKGHVDYPWAKLQKTEIAPGDGSAHFHLKVGALFRYNLLSYFSAFETQGKMWPWNVRVPGPRLAGKSPFYDVTVDRPGGLFLYGEPVAVTLRFRDGAVKGEPKELAYTLADPDGGETSGRVPFVAGAPGEQVVVPLEAKRRGTLLLEASVAGWGGRELVLARIPDVADEVGDGPTPFGYTDNLHATLDASNAVARKLGMSYCRHFLNWHRDGVEPVRGRWYPESWDKVLASNQQYGIKPMICIYGPPPWAQAEPVASQFDYEPFPFDDDVWRETISYLEKRWAGKVWAWEWLNEIVPPRRRPPSAGPCDDYLRLCRIGAETVRQIDPRVHSVLAGGLWPRGFRVDLLQGGVGRSIDVLPVHYSDLTGVLDAADDLKTAGLDGAAVWDDESAVDVTTWNLPPREALKASLAQSKWVLDHWPDELVGGAQRLFYFGGFVDPAGNWSYLLDETTPRPVAATLAVFIAKLARAKPLGKFYCDGGGVCDLFEKDGKPIVVAGAAADAGGPVRLRVGTERITCTDNQGNETVLPAPGGDLTAPLSTMKVFLEGGNLDVLKSYLILSVGEGRIPTPEPALVLFNGPERRPVLRAALWNPYSQPLRGHLQVGAGEGAAPWGETAFDIPPGGRRAVEIPVSIPAAASGTVPVQFMATFDHPNLPSVYQSARVTLLSPDMLGNLLKNGGFEEAGAKPEAAASWTIAPGVARAPADDGLGLGKFVMQFTNCPSWTPITQRVTPSPGQSYLYTAWVRNTDMVAGSNVTETMADGSRNQLTINNVFNAGRSSPEWRMLAARLDVPAGCREIAFSPLAMGTGSASFDNIRVTLYDGTIYAAEASRAKGPVSLDGTLDGWDRRCPIPLFGGNAVVPFQKDYAWTSRNLSGVAYLQWDDKALYVAVQVRDDHAVATTTGEETPEGDSVILAIDPVRRAGDKAEKGDKGDKAFEYYLSAADPGRGSGHSTLYRPPAHAGGLPSGQLAVDSSVYDISISRKDDVTTYLLRIPWEELGGIAPLAGSKFGLSLQLNDNDGQGRAAAITWGNGLLPAWNPSQFGVCTLVP